MAAIPGIGHITATVYKNCALAVCLAAYARLVLMLLLYKLYFTNVLYLYSMF